MQALKILIIDDSPTSCALMEHALQAVGYQVRIATDGREGIMMVQQGQPHCIILDVVLPGMNGFEVCRHLRNNPKLRDLPIIMVSTKNTPLDKSWAKRQGATHYLAKPFQPEEIVRLVKETLARYAPPPLPQTQAQPPTFNQFSPTSTPSFFPAQPGQARMDGNSPGPVDPRRFSGEVPAYQPVGQPPQTSNKHKNQQHLYRLIPRRPENSDLLWGRSPHFLFSADQTTRTLYEAVDGKRNIQELCQVTRLSLEDVVKALRGLLIQHRLQLCDPSGKILHSTVLYPEPL